MPLPVALLFPRDDFASKPELAATLTQVDDGARHARVATLVGGDGVPLGQSEELRYPLGVDDVRCVDDPAHPESLQRLAWPSRRYGGVPPAAVGSTKGSATTATGDARASDPRLSRFSLPRRSQQQAHHLAER